MRHPDQADAIVYGAWAAGRRHLAEHEVYALLQAAGLDGVPAHRLLSLDAPPDLRGLSGPRIVLKAVAASLVHKSDVGGVAFVEAAPAAVTAAVAAMRARLAEAGHALEAVLAVEMVPDAGRLGDEVLVGLRTTPDFGTIVTVGPGGLDSELLAASLAPGRGAAIAGTACSTPADLAALVRGTLLGSKLTGATRAARNVPAPGALESVLDAFWRLAARYGAQGDAPFILAELEVNPFAVVSGGFVALDGVCALAPRPATPPPAPPAEAVARLLAPRTVAVVGVSARGMNMGRIILRNLLAAGFAPEALRVVKADGGEIDGVACVPCLRRDDAVDLVVFAIEAGALAEEVERIVAVGAARALLLIPGGLDEKEEGRDHARRIRAALDAAHARGEAPVAVGPNSVGLRSVPGRLDTIFIPEAKLPRKTGAALGSDLALLSQSGAFMITRMERLAHVAPRYAVSLGNQLDLTVGGMLAWLAEHDPAVRVFGLYVEGFRPGDGMLAARVIRELRNAGRHVIVYKAGRTPAGRSATAGHTASVAGDHAVAEALLRAAGAVVVDDFDRFEGALQLACVGRRFSWKGRRAALLSNAGYEAVGMADGVGPRTLLPAAVSESLRDGLAAMLRGARLEHLVTPGNPLDLTPMATAAVYEAAVRACLEDDAVDLALCGVVPLTPALHTLPAGSFGDEDLARPDGLAARLGALTAGEGGKPLVMVVDAGRLYDPLAQALEAAGLPTFRSADKAVRALGAWLDAAPPAPDPR